MSDATSGAEGARISELERRVARLDAQVEFRESRNDRAEGKIDGIVERLARLEERVAHLPSKEAVVRIALGTIAFLTAVLVFQSRIQGLLGITLPH